MASVLVVAVGLLAACGGEGGGGAAAGDPQEAPVSGSPGDPTGPGRRTGGSVEGAVRDAAGGAVAGVMIVPVPLDDPAPAVPELAVVTGADGAYRWDLPEGSYRLDATRESTVVGSTEVQVEAGAAVPGDIVVR